MTAALTGATVFICDDEIQAAVMDDVAQRLVAQGVTVVRDPVRTRRGDARRYSEEDAQTLLADADVAVFTIRHVCDAALMESLPKLRGVCFGAIGVDSLDVEAATSLGIVIGHGATTGNVIGIAESNVLLILALLYDLHGSERLMKTMAPKPKVLRAQPLMGKVIGFVGYGRIAQAVAQRLSGFGVRLVACSPRMAPGTNHGGVDALSMDDVLRESDVVVVLATLTPQTRRMLGRRELALMKPSAFLVNTARGEIVDEAALFDALDQRRIAGAGLDVFEVEPLPADSPLRGLDNVILTPHMVGQTQVAADEFKPVLLENVVRILRGEMPLHCKNPTVSRERLERPMQAPQAREQNPE